MSDLISRQMALAAITKIDDGCNMDIYTDEVRELLRDLPSIEPARMRGKWITHRIGYRLGWFDECSECRFLTPEYEGYRGYHGWIFCPSCGAFMRGSDD